VAPEEAAMLCNFVHEYCPALSLVGLMAIGAFDREVSEGQVNPDFEVGLFANGICKLLIIIASV
jgi:hypothetical protein